MTKNKTKEARIEEIIDAAVKEFLKNGYEKSSMESIAKRAGLTKGGLYHHFNSKDEILLAANDIYFKPIEDFMEKAKSKKSPVKALKFFIAAYLDHWESHNQELVFIMLSWFKIYSNKEMWKLTDIYFEDMSQFYEQLLIKGIEAGELKKHDTRSRAIALLSALDGIATYIIMSSTLNSKTTAQNFEDVFLKDLIK